RRSRSTACSSVTTSALRRRSSLPTAAPSRTTMTPAHCSVTGTTAAPPTWRRSARSCASPTTNPDPTQTAWGSRRFEGELAAPRAGEVFGMVECEAGRGQALHDLARGIGLPLPRLHEDDSRTRSVRTVDSSHDRRIVAAVHWYQRSVESVPPQPADDLVA